MTEPKPDSLVADQRGMVLRNYDDFFRYAKVLAHAGLLPKNMNESEAIACMQFGLEIGARGPMQALRGVAVINGKTAVYGDFGTDLVLRSGLLKSRREYYEVDGQVPFAECPTYKDQAEVPDSLTAVCILVREGQDEPIIGRFSVGQARRANLWANSKKRPWCEYWERQLMWRARTYAYRDGFADALGGATFVEELRDIPREPDYTVAETTYDELAPAVAEEPTTEAPEELAVEVTLEPETDKPKHADLFKDIGEEDVPW